MAVKNCFLNMASQVGFMHSAKYYKEGDNGVSLRPFLSCKHLVLDIMLIRHNEQTASQVCKDRLQQIQSCFLSYPDYKRYIS